MMHPREDSEARLSPSRLATPLVRWLALVLLVASSLSPVQATVPSGSPTFTNPLTFTNRYQPFQPGAIKVFTGTKGSTKTVVVDNYLTETRTFLVNGVPVPCRILEEVSFEDGQLVEISRNHFAQADDGTVYYLGEIVDLYENGVITSHEGSWLVGGPTQPSDPPTTATASTPTVFMPANPHVGDVFKQEDLFPIVDETDQVVRARQTVSVPAGRFQDVIQILESSRISPETENKWYAPGVGMILGTARNEKLQLIASTIRTP